MAIILAFTQLECLASLNNCVRMYPNNLSIQLNALMISLGYTNKHSYHSGLQAIRIFRFTQQICTFLLFLLGNDPFKLFGGQKMRKIYVFN